MAKAGPRETRAAVAEPQDRIRSIYAARSAASATPSGGDVARVKLANPDQSLRAAFLSHLSRAKEELPREGSPPSDSVLRRAYVADIRGGSGSR